MIIVKNKNGLNAYMVELFYKCSSSSGNDLKTTKIVLATDFSQALNIVRHNYGLASSSLKRININSYDVYTDEEGE